MSKKYLISVWAIFLTIMGFYIWNPRELDDIKAVDLNESNSIILQLTQKETFGSDGVTKTTNNIELANTLLGYMREFTFRKPITLDYDKLKEYGPSYNITILDSEKKELLYIDIIGDGLMSMNDRKGTLRNYIPKNDMTFDFNFLDMIYNSI